MENKRTNLFISHRSIDANVADMIKDFLVNTGISNVHIFCSSLPGNDVNEKIGMEVKKHLKDAAIIILILSADYYKSPYCLNEAGVAWYLDDVLAIPFGLPEVNPINMYGFFNSEYKLRRLDSDDDIAYLYDQVLKHLEVTNASHSVVTQEARKLKERYQKYIFERVSSEDQDEDDEETDNEDDICEDGYHEEKSGNGKILKKGIYEKGHLIDGVEFDIVLKIAKGSLTHDCEYCYEDDENEEPVKLEELGATDFHYDEYGQYDRWFYFLPVRRRIIERGIDFFYVADKHVKMEGKKIVPTFKNFRTLEDFLSQNEPDALDEIKTGEKKYEETESAFFEIDD